MKSFFSKSLVSGFVQDYINILQREHGFDPNRGESQVDLADTATKVAYGEYVALLAVANELDLNVLPIATASREE